MFGQYSILTCDRAQGDILLEDTICSVAADVIVGNGSFARLRGAWAIDVVHHQSIANPRTQPFGRALSTDE